MSGMQSGTTPKLKHPEYRENPNRCLYLTGEIGQSTLDKLTPTINSLRLDACEPITVYIDSPGGSTYHARMLLKLLKAPTQDGDVCPLVTVVTGTAASAAADLAAAGDYAIAYPHGVILFHGTRKRPPQMLTKESAALMVQSLTETNEGFALELANGAFDRFFFRYMMLKNTFDGLRGKLQRPDMTDVECLAESLKSHAERHAALPDVALGKYNRLSAVEDYVTARWPTAREFKSKADFEAFILRCLISYQRRENKAEPSWGFSDDDLLQLREDFTVLRDYRAGAHNRNLTKQVQEWGALCLNPAEQKEFGNVDIAKREEWLIDRTGERMRALRYFFISICRSLQEGENVLSGEEAYWLGLIDEVAGRRDLACMRLIIENPPKTAASNTTPKADLPNVAKVPDQTAGTPSDTSPPNAVVAGSASDAPQNTKPITTA